eukprot:scaffold31078_cov64-Phaeocystis_antarctica.AAC.3
MPPLSPLLGARRLLAERHDSWHSALAAVTAKSPYLIGAVACGIIIIAGRWDSRAQRAAALRGVVIVLSSVVAAERKGLVGRHGQREPVAPFEKDVLVEDHDRLIGKRGADVTDVRRKCGERVSHVNKLEPSSASPASPARCGSSMRQLSKELLHLARVVHEQVVGGYRRVLQVSAHHFSQLELSRAHLCCRNAQLLGFPVLDRLAITPHQSCTPGRSIQPLHAADDRHLGRGPTRGKFHARGRPASE